MTGVQRRFGDLLREVLDEMHGPVEISPDEIAADVAEVRRRLAQVRSGSDEARAAAQGGPLLTESDLVAFFEGTTTLTHGQQRQLFADAGLRQRFEDLKRQRSARRPVPGNQETTQIAGPVVELHALAAAATDQGSDFRRPFSGGQLRISPVGIDQQVYLIFTFDDPGIATRVLLVERSRDQRIERLELPAAEDGEILLVKDLAVPSDAELVALLRDPAAVGAFLK
ncbi:MAG TPA: hypothetical protein VMU81_09575 [Acetobacteraceae bacterium]|jgi:hypothetical protein|nr:hypothetical protein [Acetobacteraceae bacterium]